MGIRMAIEVENIKWDTDGEPVEGLPDAMAFEVDLDEDEPTETEVNTAATDHMSDATGWCVEGFSFKSVRKLESSAPSP